MLSITFWLVISLWSHTAKATHQTICDENPNFWLKQFQPEFLAGTISDEKFKQFTCWIGYQQQLVEAAHIAIQRDHKEAEKLTPNHWADFQFLKYNFDRIRHNDPALFQLLDHLCHLEIQSTRLLSKKSTSINGLNITQFSDNLIKQLTFATWFLVKRRHISWQEITSTKMIIEEGELMGELVNLWETQNIGIQNNDRCNNDNNDKRQKTQEKRVLRLLMSIAQDGNGKINLRLKNRRRRRRHFPLVWSFFIMALSCLLLIILLVCSKSCHDRLQEGREVMGDLVAGHLQIIRALGEEAGEREMMPNPQWEGYGVFPGDLEFVGQFRMGIDRGDEYLAAFKNLPSVEITEPINDCAICLGPIEQGTAIRKLQGCEHIFHNECIEPWLKASNIGCPMCRKHILNTTWDGKVIPNPPQPIAGTSIPRTSAENVAANHEQIEDLA